jgi:hypothetical protein
MSNMRIVILTLLPIVMNLAIQAEVAGKDVACSEIRSVRRIPFHAGEPVSDKAYNKLLQKSWAVVPCLISEITNTRRTPDPRSAPIFGDVRVGDVAFWVIKDITGLPYDQMFPVDLVARFPSEGVYAYFDWVHNPDNRKVLQKNVQQWYMSHKPKTATP